MTNVATTLLDFILNLLNDPEAMAAYQADREGALTAAGLGGCGDEVGTEGDYVYCPAARPGGGPGARVEDDDDDSGGGKRRGRPAGDVDAAQALPNTLPLTGGHPAVIAMIGLGFLMVGAGGRLQQRPGAGRDSA